MCSRLVSLSLHVYRNIPVFSKVAKLLRIVIHCSQVCCRFTVVARGAMGSCHCEQVAVVDLVDVEEEISPDILCSICSTG